jgi:hypothetical protein
MTMKKRYAISKICPIAHSLVRDSFMCIADDCAMWKWTKTEDYKFKVPKAEYSELPYEEWEGQCGLMR